MLTAAKDFPPVSASVTAARLLVEATLRLWHLPDHALDMAIITDELVANAVQHARAATTLLTVRLTRLGDVLRVEVGDGDPSPPRVLRAEVSDVGHRGMFFVERIATRWGVSPRAEGAEGKVVWAEVDLTPAPGRAQ
ncbi:ATP-binding protein [Sphaerisporangium album]|uniref:ATP-binding protein n=1 Tax=Sphaerisporangium album TaxID=509200 RepID=A0A367FKK2_9ACTN|nr:ATP-binding protein [Sphaerisporangium album]RCG30362.1 ATP-binding protein [Sphaerisporangium album]